MEKIIQLTNQINTWSTVRTISLIICAILAVIFFITSRGDEVDSGGSEPIYYRRRNETQEKYLCVGLLFVALFFIMMIVFVTVISDKEDKRNEVITANVDNLVKKEKENEIQNVNIVKEEVDFNTKQLKEIIFNVNGVDNKLTFDTPATLEDSNESKENRTIAVYKYVLIDDAVGYLKGAENPVLDAKLNQKEVVIN